MISCSRFIFLAQNAAFEKPATTAMHILLITAFAIGIIALAAPSQVRIGGLATWTCLAAPASLWLLNLSCCLIKEYLNRNVKPYYSEDFHSASQMPIPTSAITFLDPYFPESLFNKILTCLDPDSLLAANQVNKTWYFQTKSKALWKPIIRQNFRYLNMIDWDPNAENTVNYAALYRGIKKCLSLPGLEDIHCSLMTIPQGYSITRFLEIAETISSLPPANPLLFTHVKENTKAIWNEQLLNTCTVLMTNQVTLSGGFVPTQKHVKIMPTLLESVAIIVGNYQFYNEPYIVYSLASSLRYNDPCFTSTVLYPSDGHAYTFYTTNHHMANGWIKMAEHKGTLGSSKRVLFRVHHPKINP